MKIKSKYIIEGIFSYLDKQRVMEIIRYNHRIQNALNINIFHYQKLFIENHFSADLSKYNIKTLLKFFNKNYNNFTKPADEKNLKTIIEDMNENKIIKSIKKNNENYLECNQVNINELKTLVQNNLNNLRILKLTFGDSLNLDEKEIYLNYDIPNLYKLKIIGNELNNKFIISYNLLNKIQYLILSNSVVEIIDINDDFIELNKLKYLKISDNEYINKEIEISCPNLEYLTFGDNEYDSSPQNDIFLKFEEKNYEYYINEISKKYKNIKFFKIIISQSLTNNEKSYYFEIKSRKNENNLTKYELKKAEAEGAYSINNISDAYYYKKVWFSNQEKNKNELDNCEEIYLSNKVPEINIFKKIDKYNNLLQYIDININNYTNKNKSDIKKLISNLIYFKFLKAFSLSLIINDKYVSDKNLFTKNDLFSIIENLSQLQLIENIKISLINPQFKLLKNDNNKILNYFPSINIEQEEDYLTISLNDDIFEKDKYLIFNIKPSILEEYESSEEDDFMDESEEEL